MNPRLMTIAAAATVAALALPGAAAAHGRSSAQTVQSHIRGADRALAAVAELVRDREEAAVAVAFARNRAQTLAAQREARRVAGRDAGAGATALRDVARLNDRQAGVYVDLVDDAVGPTQVALAKAAAASVKGRDTAVAQLTALAEQLPAEAAAGIARAIAALMGDGDREIQALGAAATAVPAEAQAWLQLATERAQAGLATARAKLGELLPTLPPQAQPHVAAAMETIAGVAEMVSGILDGLFGGGTSDSGGSPLPIPVQIPAGPPAWP